MKSVFSNLIPISNSTTSPDLLQEQIISKWKKKSQITISWLLTKKKCSVYIYIQKISYMLHIFLMVPILLLEERYTSLYKSLQACTRMHRCMYISIGSLYAKEKSRKKEPLDYLYCDFVIFSFFQQVFFFLRAIFVVIVLAVRKSRKTF